MRYGCQTTRLCNGITGIGDGGGYFHVHYQKFPLAISNGSNAAEAVAPPSARQADRPHPADVGRLAEMKTFVRAEINY